VVTAELSIAEDKITQSLNEMVSRGRSVSSYLNRVLVKKFQQHQLDRWASEGASEGEQWESINREYAKRKIKKFAGFPGGGTRMMVATGHLSSGAQMKDNAYFFKIVTDTSFQVNINTSALAYAPFAALARPYMEFSDDTISDWKKGIRDYICKNGGGL
jgi:hypothetical protein